MTCVPGRPQKLNPTRLHGAPVPGIRVSNRIQLMLELPFAALRLSCRFSFSVF
jgi:hypothetical protein